MVEFEALGRVQRKKRDRGASVEIVGVAYERGAIQEIGKRLAALGAFGHSVHQFIQVIDAGKILGGIALAQHVQVTGGFENKGDELRGWEGRHFFAQLLDQLSETAKRSQGARRSRINEFTECAPNRAVALASQGLERIDRDFADPTGRRVQNAQQCDIVVSKHCQPHVGENVFDFGALIEAEAAEQAVTGAPGTKDIFERPRLRVGAIHHSAMRGAILSLDLAHALADILRLGTRIAGFVENEIGTLAPRRRKFFSDAPDVFRYQGPGGIQNLLARTVILFDAENLRVGEILGEAQNIPDVGAAPTIDGLVLIAYDA